MEWLTDIIGWVAVVVASWGGVWLTNRHQLKAQKSDYEYKTKSETLAKVARVLLVHRALLLRMPTITQQEFDKEVIQNMLPLELSLWATNSTVNAVMEYACAIAVQILRLQVEKISLDMLKKEIESSADSSKITLNTLRNFGNRMRKFATDCHDANAQLEDKEIEVVACMRRELGVAFDEDTYRQMMKEVNARALAMVREYFSNMEKFENDLLQNNAEFISENAKKMI